MYLHRLTISVLIIVSLFGAFGCHEGGKEGLPPEVALSGGHILRTELGGSVLIAPSFANLTDNAAISWFLNDKVVGHSENYRFTAEKPGVYYITVEIKTEYGTAFLEIRIDVPAPEPEPVPPLPAETEKVSFERHEFHVAQGRTIRLLPLDIDTTKTFTFLWKLDGIEEQQGDEALYRFEAVRQGRFTVEFQMLLDGAKVFADTLLVVVCPPEGSFRRIPSSGSSPHVSKIYEYTPAPGQYINENYTANTMEEACEFAIGRIKEGKYVTLGGFGGYIVAGFDHSIENDGDYNFAVKNTLYTNYSEPGIVWVMQDEDGNGLPDDTWYELKGSEYGLECTVQDYAVTYYRPAAPAQSVAWTDNRGGQGVVDYLSAYHHQEYYYPLWVKEDSYTLRGTRLESRNYDSSGRGVMWINPDYGWGYADNFSETDMLVSRATGITAGCNHFRISDAVTFDGRPANLQYIDFIKIQTGLNTKSGWLGEVSTEIIDIIDFNLVK